MKSPSAEASSGRSNRSSKTFSEFFAGIGLVREGLTSSGWACRYANDIDPKKRQMYFDHFRQERHFHLEDIWNTDSILAEMAESGFLATASFPCIDLSLAGHWRGLNGEHSSTFFAFAELLKRLGTERPRLIMIENVAGFLQSGRGSDFRHAVQLLSELGYWIDALVVDAKWFVPQSRPRLFIFGFHDRLESQLVLREEDSADFTGDWKNSIERTSALRPESLQRLMHSQKLDTGWACVDFSPPRQSAYRLADFIDLDDGQDWWGEDAVDKHYEMMEPLHRNKVDGLLETRAVAAGTAFRRTRRGKTRTEVRFDLAGCLRTPKGGSAKQIVVVADRGRLRMRWMSAREYARLQGAESYEIEVPPIQAMYGFGDAVCVPVIRWIDRSILTPVFESANNRRISHNARQLHSH